MTESLQIQLKKGVLEMCVLALLSKGDNYAYDIASRMAEAVGMGEGTIYPLMRRMQNDGLVSTYLQESGSGPPRKYYKLTKAGTNALKAQIADWAAFEIAVRKFLGDVTLTARISLRNCAPACRACILMTSTISWRTMNPISPTASPPAAVRMRLLKHWATPRGWPANCAPKWASSAGKATAAPGISSASSWR